jgi:type III pantothenate kinase
MLLLIDIGNTRVKWSVLEGDQLGPQRAAAHAGWGQTQWSANVLATVAQPSRVLVSNVGGVQLANDVDESVQQRWGLRAQFLFSVAAAGGIRNAYREPAKLGVDRWLAMIGAHALQAGYLCIVSIGTAMTIDAVDASGLHLGGLITPGPDLMVTTLLDNTSDIAQRAQGDDDAHALFANSTRGGVRQGGVHALAALIERAMHELQRVSAEAPLLLITGGAASQVEPLLSSPFRVVPDLVLRGLAVLAVGEGLTVDS